MNSTVDFGINFAKGQIFGYLLNDAGAGISGITIELKREPCGTAAGCFPKEEPCGTAAPGCSPRRILTGENGKFSFTGLAPGDYSISTVSESYPAGYALADLAGQTVTVEPGKPASTEFHVRALRSIAGKIVVYDKATLQTVPLAGVTVRLKPVSSAASAENPPESAKGVLMEVKTGPTGAYIFRNLPAGTYTITIENDGKEITRSVTLPPEPASLRDVNLNAGSR
jgi:uncharacterized protein (DUF2141 family)